MSAEFHYYSWNTQRPSTEVMTSSIITENPVRNMHQPHLILLRVLHAVNLLGPTVLRGTSCVELSVTICVVDRQ